MQAKEFQEEQKNEQFIVKRRIGERTNDRTIGKRRGDERTKLEKYLRNWNERESL